MITSGARGVHFFLCLRYLLGLCVAFFDSLLLSADFLAEEAHLCGSWNCRRLENQACASNSSHLLPAGQFYICPGVTLQDVTESPATRIFIFKWNHRQFGFLNYDDVFADSQMWLYLKATLPLSCKYFQEWRIRFLLAVTSKLMNISLKLFLCLR